MSDAIATVSTDVSTFLSQEVPSTSPEGTVLAFEPIGLPINASDFNGNLLQSTAAVDAIADVTAKVSSNGEYQPTLVTATSLFDLLLSGVAANADDTTAYGQLLNQAQEAYAGGSTDTTGSPENWWDPACAGWAAYSVSSSTPTTPAVPVVPRLPWTWRVLPPDRRILLTAPALSLFAAERARAELVAEPVPVKQAPVRAGSPVRPVVGPAELAFRPVGDIPVMRPPIGPARVAPTTTVIRPTTGIPATTVVRGYLFAPARSKILGITSVSEPAPVQADSLTVSFEYLTVTLNRPWWSGLLLENNGWYLPGYAAGALAPGALAGTNAVCGGLPIAMVLVRNLLISGSWTSSDEAAMGAASTFGPFSLVGRTISTDVSIQVEGTQLIGWVVSPLPQLPPLTDPGMAPATPPDPLAELPLLTIGSTGGYVGRAQALLGALRAAGTPPPPVTGTFDASTAAEVERFQAGAGIPTTSQVDLITWHHLLGI